MEGDDAGNDLVGCAHEPRGVSVCGCVKDNVEIKPLPRGGRILGIPGTPTSSLPQTNKLNTINN